MGYQLFYDNVRSYTLWTWSKFVINFTKILCLYSKTTQLTKQLIKVHITYETDQQYDRKIFHKMIERNRIKPRTDTENRL
jgi:hypothetical protein